MSAERWFDGVARTLAEPMPRRRAVRVIGVSLAALAVPGLRPPLGHAQTVCTAKTCGYDRRCCTKGAEANYQTYCCPRPSWQFQCGSQQNAYRCVNTCKGRTDEKTGKNKTGQKEFPCTALLASRESGINGVCCNSSYHIGCVRVGPPPERRPDGSVVDLSWQPSCCPKGFGFCGGVCCQPPNRCRSGRCTCPAGGEACGKECCGKRERCRQCFEFGTRVPPGQGSYLDATLLRTTCCPEGYDGCCGARCCKEFGCCGDKCCPARTSVCASSRGKKVCCPKSRIASLEDQFVCCPPGTGQVPTTRGCCPDGALDCCGPINGPGMNCGPGKLCVNGKCVVP